MGEVLVRLSRPGDPSSLDHFFPLMLLIAMVVLR